eukprot:jgi/Chrzof1/10370/Cz04g39130.t1
MYSPVLFMQQGGLGSEPSTPGRSASGQLKSNMRPDGGKTDLLASQVNERVEAKRHFINGHLHDGSMSGATCSDGNDDDDDDVDGDGDGLHHDADDISSGSPMHTTDGAAAKSAPASARFRTATQYVVRASVAEHLTRMLQKKEVQQELRTWADEVMSGRPDPFLADDEDVSPTGPTPAAVAAANTSTPMTTPRMGAGAELRAQWQASIEQQVNRRLEEARGEWEMSIMAEMENLQSLREDNRALRAGLLKAHTEMERLKVQAATRRTRDSQLQQQQQLATSDIPLQSDEQQVVSDTTPYDLELAPHMQPTQEEQQPQQQQQSLQLGTHIAEYGELQDAAQVVTEHTAHHSELLYQPDESVLVLQIRHSSIDSSTVTPEASNMLLTSSASSAADTALPEATAVPSSKQSAADQTVGLGQQHSVAQESMEADHQDNDTVTAGSTEPPESSSLTENANFVETANCGPSIVSASGQGHIPAPATAAATRARSKWSAAVAATSATREPSASTASSTATADGDGATAASKKDMPRQPRASSARPDANSTPQRQQQQQQQQQRVWEAERIMHLLKHELEAAHDKERGLLSQIEALQQEVALLRRKHEGSEMGHQLLQQQEASELQQQLQLQRDEQQTAQQLEQGSLPSSHTVHMADSPTNYHQHEDFVRQHKVPLADDQEGGQAQQTDPPVIEETGDAPQEDILLQQDSNSQLLQQQQQQQHNAVQHQHQQRCGGAQPRHDGVISRDQASQQQQVSEQQQAQRHTRSHSMNLIGDSYAADVVIGQTQMATTMKLHGGPAGIPSDTSHSHPQVAIDPRSSQHVTTGYNGQATYRLLDGCSSGFDSAMQQPGMQLQSVSEQQPTLADAAAQLHQHVLRLRQELAVAVLQLQVPAHEAMFMPTTGWCDADAACKLQQQQPVAPTCSNPLNATQLSQTQVALMGTLPGAPPAATAAAPSICSGPYPEDWMYGVVTQTWSHSQQLVAAQLAACQSPRAAPYIPMYPVRPLSAAQLHHTDHMVVMPLTARSCQSARARNSSSYNSISIPGTTTATGNTGALQVGALSTEQQHTEPDQNTTSSAHADTGCGFLTVRSYRSISADRQRGSSSTLSARGLTGPDVSAGPPTSSSNSSSNSSSTHSQPPAARLRAFHGQAAPGQLTAGRCTSPHAQYPSTDVISNDPQPDNSSTGVVYGEPASCTPRKSRTHHSVSSSSTSASHKQQLNSQQGVIAAAAGQVPKLNIASLRR